MCKQADPCTCTMIRAINALERRSHKSAHISDEIAQALRAFEPHALLLYRPSDSCLYDS